MIDAKQILLFPAAAVSFDSNGTGHLSDAARCVVTEELNGGFELELDYPIGGAHFAEIQQRSIIYAKARPNDTGQPFRVYKITTPIGGLCTIYARHISYDLTGVIVEPFTAGGVAAALSGIETYAVGDMDISFWTDKTTVGVMSFDAPATARSLLGGGKGTILDTYGGEWEFDGLVAKLHSHRGTDRGFKIAYGKNLTDFKQEESCAACYTALYPYWKGDSGIVRLPEKTVPVSGTYGYTRVLAHDFSQAFAEEPTAEELREAAEDYITANSIGVPSVSIDISFAMLTQDAEYARQAMLEQVYLGDTVTVDFTKIGVLAQAQVRKAVFNVLLDRYDSVSVGDAAKTVADTIAGQQQQIDNVDFSGIVSEMEAVASRASQLITGNRGGYVVMHSSTGGTTPDEILVMDTADIETATQVWRWNRAGLGYSNTGYAGPYSTAITQDGQIVADFITTGELSANVIKAGQIHSREADSDVMILDLDRAWAQFQTIYREGGILQYTSYIDMHGDAIQLAVKNALGQLVCTSVIIHMFDGVLHNGEIVITNKEQKYGVQMFAENYGAAINLGKIADGVTRFAEYSSGQLHVWGHHHFTGKSDGLIDHLRSGAGTVSDASYSAFIVIARPAQNGYRCTLFIPSGRYDTYQVADEASYSTVVYSAGRFTGSYIEDIYGVS